MIKTLLACVLILAACFSCVEIQRETHIIKLMNKYWQKIQMSNLDTLEIPLQGNYTTSFRWESIA